MAPGDRILFPIKTSNLCSPIQTLQFILYPSLDGHNDENLPSPVQLVFENFARRNKINKISVQNIIGLSSTPDCIVVSNILDCKTVVIFPLNSLLAKARSAVSVILARVRRETDNDCRHLL